MVANHDDTSRPRGILSPTDREFLIDREKYAQERSRQAVDKRIHDIQERTANGILDFILLFEGLEEEEREQIFAGYTLPRDKDDADRDPDQPHANPYSDAETEEGITHAIALFYLESVVNGRFEALLENGINKAERRRAGVEEARPIVDVDLDVSAVKRRDIHSAIERFASEDVDDLSGEEQAAIIWLLQRFTDSEELETLEDRFNEYLEDLEQALSDKPRKSRGEYRREKRKRLFDRE